MFLRTKIILCAFVTSLWLLLGYAWADTPTPRIKPAPPNLSTYLDDSEARTFRSTLRSARKGHWNSVKNKRKRLTDPVAKDIIFWIQAMKDPHVSSKDLDYVLDNLSDWPRISGIQAKAEYRLFDRPLSANKTIAWFAGRQPKSGEGQAALASAYYKIGNNSDGDYWLKKAWRESKLTRDRQKRLYKKYKNRLTKGDHAARSDYLIWQGSAHFSKVQGLLAVMSKNDKALMDARMRVLKNRSGMDAAIKRVPTDHLNDTGLLYARGKWRRQKKTKEYALPVYLQISKPVTSHKGRERLWRERKLMAYWAMQENRHNDAYTLTRHHGANEGTVFAEAEFLAGWLSLRKLNKPEQALTHFKALSQSVSYPVSIARANYWLGRTYDRMGSMEAHSYYSKAAKFSNTYYGFLASEKLNPRSSTIILPPEPKTPLELSSLSSDARIKAMKLLGEANEEHYFTMFSFHMDDAVQSLDNLSLISKISSNFNYMRPSVRAAKQASRFQSMLTESGYPMPQAIMNLPDKFDKPFVLAIARQESEFNFKAVSSARAYGMMQMINSTAHATARKHRIPYNRSRLTTDIDYSANLGALHLNDLLKDFNGSYILAAAAYNAGAHRARQWIQKYGDPRTGEVDPVDWIESIPFSETRNYIQRVIENLQVYRARMNDNMAKNRILHDITYGQ